MADRLQDDRPRTQTGDAKDGSSAPGAVDVLQALRRSEEKFAKAFHGSTSAMAISRLCDGALLDVNHAWLRVTGFAREGALGRTTAQLRIWSDPEDRKEFVRQLRQHSVVHNQEYRFLRADGEEWTGLVSAQTAEIDGEPVIISSILDVTERRRAEDALRAANEQLQEADRRKNQFLAVLSHELRNPLAPIRNSVYILEHAAPGGQQAAHARQVIERQTRQLARLVDDLLEVTRISQGKIRLQREVVELNALVQRCAEDHRDQFLAAGVAFEVHVPGPPVCVDGDPARLAQVVGNLLGNAAKFTGRGGRAALSLETAGGKAIIRIRDTGVGIPPELLGRLFEPFVQADDTLHRTQGGLGLGLAVLKGLVELHGGTVAARSEGVGSGAEFVVTLPAAAAPSAPAGVARDGAGRAPRRVLVIEDDPDAAESLKAVLQLHGDSVEIAEDGAKGVERARETKPDVVLCDIGLPGMDGFAVARALREDPALSRTRLIALSGYAQPEDVERTRTAGFDRHLAKPVDPEEILRI